MTRKLFGTDGIRGTANIEPMTPETALKVAMAVGDCFHNGTHKHLVVIGKDTRLSGYARTGADRRVHHHGHGRGPGRAATHAGDRHADPRLRADTGVVISASHNPFADNGIKLFGPDGYKLSDELELKIEADLQNGPLR